MTSALAALLTSTVLLGANGQPAAVVGANGQPAATVQAPQQAGMELHQIEWKLIEQTNAARARHGRPPLAIDMSLVQSARRQAAWMARHGVLQHGSAPVAENIAMGQSSCPEVVQDWLNSPGHRANLLNTGHRRLGVAAYRGRNGQVYWCQQFLR